VEEGQRTLEEQQDPAPPPPPPPPGKKHRVLVWIIMLALAAGGYYAVQHYGVLKRPQASRLVTPGAVAVTTTIAKRGSIGVYLEAIGTVTPVYTSSITAQVNGLVTAVHYIEGQIVHKGDPLIDIDPRPFQAQVLQAEGTLQRDVNVFAQSKMDLERYRAAWARNAIPKQQLDDQEKLVLQNEGWARDAYVKEPAEPSF